MSSAGNARPPPSPVYTLRGAGSPVTALSFTGSVTPTLISGCQYGKVHIWDLESRRSKQTFEAHCGKSVVFVKSESGSQNLLTHGRDGLLKFWKCSESSFELESELACECDGFCRAELLSQDASLSSGLIALPGKDSTINIYDLNNHSFTQRLSVSDGKMKLGLCMCLCAVPTVGCSPTQLLAGYESGKVILWDITGGKVVSEATLHEDAVMCMAYSSDCNKGVSGSADNTLVVWRLTDSGIIEVTNKIECPNPGFNQIKFRQDSKIVVTAGWDKSVRMFSAKSLKPVCVLAYHRDSVNCVEFSHHDMLAAGSKDHLISLWDVFRNR